jgi:hypothetical protein
MVDYMMIPKQKRKTVIVPYHATDIHKRKCQRHVEIRVFEKHDRKEQTHSLEGTFQSMAHVCIGKDRLFPAVVLGLIRPKIFGM